MPGLLVVLETIWVARFARGVHAKNAKGKDAKVFGELVWARFAPGFAQRTRRRGGAEDF